MANLRMLARERSLGGKHTVSPPFKYDVADIVPHRESRSYARTDDLDAHRRNRHEDRLPTWDENPNRAPLPKGM